MVSVCPWRCFSAASVMFNVVAPLLWSIPHPIAHTSSHQSLNFWAQSLPAIFTIIFQLKKLNQSLNYSSWTNEGPKLAPILKKATWVMSASPLKTTLSSALSKTCLYVFFTSSKAKEVSFEMRGPVKTEVWPKEPVTEFVKEWAFRINSFKFTRVGSCMWTSLKPNILSLLHALFKFLMVEDDSHGNKWPSLYQCFLFWYTLCNTLCFVSYVFYI